MTPADLTALPVSAVPAAFDRGFLYSPTLNLTCRAPDGSHLFDYRPGDLFEPMPDAPRGDPQGFAWWWDNIARTPVPDFLGLRAGDRITIQHATSTGPGEVLETVRFGALVRYPYPDSSRSGQMYVHRRNDNGNWY